MRNPPSVGICVACRLDIDKTAWSMLANKNTMTAMCKIHTVLLSRLHWLCCCLLVLGCASAAAAVDDGLALLEGYREESSVAARLPRPVSRSPENITIVTAAEIETLNARTLADILQTVSGVQLAANSGPAALTMTMVQGANINHVQFMLDGVQLNSLSENAADIGLIPARIIERIEIVKGAASSAWGQGLGGVVNIITKSAAQGRLFSGVGELGQGERGNKSGGLELAGSHQRLGYYLAGGYLQSGGSLPNTAAISNNLYGKLQYELPGDGKLSLSLFHARARRGDLAYQPLNVKAGNEAQRQLLTLTLQQPLSSQFELEIGVRHSISQTVNDTALIDPALQLQVLRYDERVSGAGVKLLWRSRYNLMAVGADYEHARMHGNESLAQLDYLKRSVDRWGFYLNDTLTLGDFAFSPGVRLDLTGSSGSQFSPSFGVTWQLTDSTLLRAYTAKGYSLPTLGLESGSEKVWTTQLGVESSALPYLWLKGSLFRNEIQNIARFDWGSGSWQKVRQIRQGVETEFRTAPLWYTSLNGGYSFVDATNPSNNLILKDVARHTLQLGLRYDDKRWLKGALQGRHIWWNAAEFRQARYYGLIWDLHLTATPLGRSQYSPELFFSIRNIFNGAQYWDDAYRNPGRTFDGGLRFKF